MYINLKQLMDITKYPTGESHTKLLGDYSLASTRSVVIEAQVFNFEDICRVIAVNRWFKHRGYIPPSWFIPYFPFARDDRRNETRDCFELGLALDLVREEGLHVTTVDPHSDVSGQLRHIPQSEVVSEIRRRGYLPDSSAIVIPDIGASKKAGTWIGKNRHVQCLKNRDIQTGKLSGFEALTGDLNGADCFIMDDICDAGGTFLGLAEKLKEKNAGKLTLAVTHGLFTKGTDALAKVFDKIICFGPDAKDGDPVIVIPYQSLYSKPTL